MSPVNLLNLPSDFLVDDTGRHAHRNATIRCWVIHYRIDAQHAKRSYRYILRDPNMCTDPHVVGDWYILIKDDSDICTAIDYGVQVNLSNFNIVVDVAAPTDVNAHPNVYGFHHRTFDVAVIADSDCITVIL